MVKYLKFDTIKTPETTLEFRDTTDTTTVNRFSGIPDNVVSVVGDELEIAKLIAAQAKEINVQEISKDEFQTAVADSDQIAEINRQVKSKIARRYDIADEIAMLKRSPTHPKRIDYESFIVECLMYGDKLKEEIGYDLPGEDV